MKLHRWKTESSSETVGVGMVIGRWAKIASRKSPVVIFVDGDMGVGKTTIARGIISGAGIKIEKFAGSPSYTIVNQYKNDLSINHIDLWRYSGSIDDVVIEEFYDYLNADIVIIEWGRSLYSAVDNCFKLMISGGVKRTIEITAA